MLWALLPTALAAAVDMSPARCPEESRATTAEPTTESILGSEGAVSALPNHRNGIPLVMLRRGVTLDGASAAPLARLTVVTGNLSGGFLATLW
jgi:hypothetical protein